jgi:hypothetical protein
MNRLVCTCVLVGLLWQSPCIVFGQKVPPPKFETIALRGRVVWLNDALKRRYGITTVPESKLRVLALETADGELHPLVEDTRGRAFRIDKRLRNTDMELLVRRYEGLPSIQVIRVYAVKKDGKFQLDYWCDVCAIVMFELGPCDCCQDANRFRERRVDN